MKKEMIKFYWLCVCLIFFYQLSAQSNVKSGNIRACDVWGNTGGSLQNINIINNTTIQSNATTPTISSMALAGVNSVIELNGTDAIIFTAGGSTSKSACAYSSNTAGITNTGATFPGWGSATNEALISYDANVTVSSDVTTDQTLILRYKASLGLRINYSCTSPASIIRANNFYMDIRIWKNGVFVFFDATGPPCSGFTTYDGSTHTTFFGDVVQSEAYRYTDYPVTGKAGDVFTVNVRVYPDRFTGTSCTIPTFGGNLYHQYCQSGSMTDGTLLVKTNVELFRSPTF